MISFFNRILKGRIRDKVDLKKDDVIAVLGDSHSRAFSFNENFFPIFLGPGKTMNFVNDQNLNQLKSAVSKALSALEVDRLILYLGEPDTRYFLGKGWYPWEPKEDYKVDVSGAIDASMKRYSSLLDSLPADKEFVILNVTPSRREEQNKIVDIYNKELALLSSSRNIPFIQINSEIYSDDDLLIKDKYYSDHVHMELSIQELVEEKLLELGWIKNRKYNQGTAISNAAVKEKYQYDKRFGCYVLKD